MKIGQYFYQNALLREQNNTMYNFICTHNIYKPYYNNIIFFINVFYSRSKLYRNAQWWFLEFFLE